MAPSFANISIEWKAVLLLAAINMIFWLKPPPRLVKENVVVRRTKNDPGTR
jgi:hypothetical protein